MKHHLTTLELPLIPILRGINPSEAVAIGNVLHGAGLRVLEVPLNSPAPFESLSLLQRAFPDCLIGAGTVLTAAHVLACRDAGADLIVAPNFDAAVVSAARNAGLQVLPGVATPSEALSAFKAGASALKIFPAESVTAKVLRAWMAALPTDIKCFAVGGIDAGNMAQFLHAGAFGFGIGSALYRAGDSAEQVSAKLGPLLSAWHAAHGRHQT